MPLFDDTPPAPYAVFRTRLAGAGQASPAGGFEILAITAGEGNGWKFTEETLRSSLPLWQGVEVFIDHDGQFRSLRDLAGVCHDPAWDEIHRGVRLHVRPAGPSADLLTEVGNQMLSAEPVKPNVGFSADVLFSSIGARVQKILRVFSVDLVYQPARGGQFLRALNQHQSITPYPKEVHMSNPQTNPNPSDDETRLQLSACLLESSLAAARLPAPAAESLRQRFAGRAFQPQELTDAISEVRSLVSALSGAAVVQGPGRIHSVADSRDQLQAAVDDLFEAPRTPGLEQIRPARLSGIRELYLLLTGDYDLHGGYFPERTQLATTADFTGLVKNALNKLVANTWQELGRAGYDWWSKIAVVEHCTSLNDITGTLVGTVGALPVVAEGAAYTELAVGDSPETASFVKYGGYIPLTLELIDRDETRKLKTYPRELAAAGMRRVSSLVAGIFTANSHVGPTMADGGALFNATAVTTAGGHANLRTTALSAAEWDAVSTAVFNQPMLIKNAAGVYGTGPKMAVNPRYCLVPRQLQLTAMKILYPALENAANIYSENMQRGQPGDVLTVPEWEDATNWAAACDPHIAPAVFIGERFGILPEVFIAGSELSPAVFTNDEHRLKVRHFLAVWVNDFRPLHKSNVAG